MDPLTDFAARYRRFLQRSGWIPLWLPVGLRTRLAAAVGRRDSPYLPKGPEIVAAMESGLGIDHEVAEQAWLHWRESHGQFGLTVFRYGRLDREWVRREVEIAEPELVEQLCTGGGLGLTYHTHHQNTLGCLLGVLGCHVSTLAASAKSSPLYPYIGKHIERVNTRSVAHFNGGCYVYTDKPKKLVRETRRLLQEGRVLGTFCDVHQPTPGAKTYAFLGRSMAAPVGSVDIALRLGVPLYALMLFFIEGRFRLRMRRLEVDATGLDGVMTQYFSFLEELCREEPSCWQGWEWYGNLPQSD